MTNQEFIESIRLENEEWRPVVGYESLYMVSSLGRVIGLPRVYKRYKGINRKDYRILKNVRHQRGKLFYYRVSLSKDYERKLIYVHRLVAMAFIPNPNNYPFIDHIDRNGLNNSASNLRWCTQEMNMRNENTKKIHVSALQKTFSKPVVMLKGNLFIRSYKSMSDAEKDGFRVSLISSVCTGKNKTHKGYKWMYLSDYEKTLITQDVKELSTNA